MLEMIGYCQVGNNLSSRCGGKQFGDQRPHTFLRSFLLDTIRQNFIDYSKYIIYTGFRTDVCVYKGVRRMKEYKDKFIALLEKLTVNQIKYIYYLTCKLFGQAPD